MLRTSVLLPVLVSTLLLASCKACGDPPPSSGEAGPGGDAQRGTPSNAPSSGLAFAADASDPSDGHTSDEVSADATTTATPPLGGDAGASLCRLAYGPAEQPFRGPAALAVTPRELQLVVNDAGKPRIYAVPIAPPAKGQPAVVPPRPASFVGMRWPPCELAGRFAYCQGGAGAIVRTTLGGADAKTVAKSKPGSRFAAASLGGEHGVVAFLDSRYTTEGHMLQAFVALDDKEPQRLSEDGAGATAVRFLPRGDAPVAVYIDARTAMVPVHARPTSLVGADLKLGADTVLFVGGAPERGVDFSVALLSGSGSGGGKGKGTKSFALLPIPRETLDFGVAAIPIEDPPKEDVAAVWSFYPNGIDPAPIAAAPARDGKSAWIVRVRPREKAPGSPRVLELGRIDGEGAFSSLGEIASGAAVSDASLIEDASGSLWITYGDSKATWLERRVCGG